MNKTRNESIMYFLHQAFCVILYAHFQWTVHARFFYSHLCIMYICVSAYLMNKKSIKISLLRQDIKRNEEKKVNYSNKYFSPFLQHETFFTWYSRFTSIWVGKKVNFFFSKTRICHRLRQSGALQNSNPSSILFSRCAAVTLGCEQHR